MLLPFLALIGGRVVLTWGADRLVPGASGSAGGPGVPPLLVGLTIVAIGNRLPDLATPIAATWQGDADLAIGHVFESDLLAPVTLENAVSMRDYRVMLGLTVLLFFAARGGRRASPGRVRRSEGALPLSLFAAGLALLAWNAAA